MKRRLLLAFAAGAVAAALLVALVDATDRVDWLVAPLLVPDAAGPAEAIVVPGAGVLGPRCEPNFQALRRTIAAARLFREGRAPLVVFSGGPSTAFPGCTIATSMGEFAVQLGVPREAVVLETASRTTHENAVDTRALLAPRRIRHVLVVTDALHVRRAAACFRHEGFTVDTVGVPAMLAYGSNTGMLRMGVHEYGALLYYRLRGFI